MSVARGRRLSLFLLFAVLATAAIPPLREAVAPSVPEAATAKTTGVGETMAATNALPSGAARFRPVKPGVVTVSPVRTEDLEKIEKTIVAGGGRLLGRCGLKSAPSIRAEVDAATLNRLLDMGEIRWLANPSRKIMYNDVAAGVMGVTNVWPRTGESVASLGLTGKEQFITTSDSGIDTGVMETIHRDFANSLIGFAVVEGCNASDQNGHGTHTAGSLVGDGTMSDGRYKGMAYGAKLWAWFCGGSDDHIYTPYYVDDLFRPEGLTQGTACIHSASWGGNHFYYDEFSYDIDAYCWEHPDFLPVFAAGNSYGAGTVSSEPGAKNALAVGATENDRGGVGGGGWPCRYPNRLAEFSSRGPMPDGRIKPDVVAPGTAVYSTKSTLTGTSGSYYRYMAGTSMACPLTAGSMALIREWLVDLRGLTNPSAALMKAVVTGGAVDLFGRPDTDVKSSAPNSEEGWGRVNVAESVAPNGGRAVYLADWIPFHGGSNVLFTVTTTNGAPLDVQLVWIDYPGTLDPDETKPVLVNDLDLTVRFANEAMSTNWFGNGGAERDRLNNVESVRLASAAAGTYEISVRGTVVRHSSDEGGAAALYLRGAFDPGTIAVTTVRTDKVTLTISSSSPGDRLAEPPVGVCSYDVGETVTVAADDWSVVFGAGSVDVLGDTAAVRYPFVGFTGTGDVPSSGNTNVVTFTITQDSTINWSWDAAAPQYRYREYLRLYGCAEGRYSPAYDLFYDYPYCLRDVWLDADAKFTVALPGDVAYDPFVRNGYFHSTDGWRTYRKGNWTYRFAQAYYLSMTGDAMILYDDWTGQPWPSVDITMDEGCSLILDYYEKDDRIDVRGNRTWAPTWWILRYMWWLDVEGGIDASETGDPDGDGFDNLAEYRVDTDPMDPMSRLAMTGVSATNVEWTAGSEVRQVLETGASPTGPWRATYTNDTGLPRMWYNIKTSPSNGFYRVNVPKEFQR